MDLKTSTDPASLIRLGRLFHQKGARSNLVNVCSMYLVNFPYVCGVCSGPPLDHDDYGFKILPDYEVEDMKLLAKIQALEIRSHNLLYQVSLQPVPSAPIKESRTKL